MSIYKELVATSLYNQSSSKASVILEFNDQASTFPKLVHVSVNEFPYLAGDYNWWQNTKNLVSSQLHSTWIAHFEQYSINKNIGNQIFPNSHTIQNFTAVCCILDQYSFLEEQNINYTNFEALVNQDPFVLDKLNSNRLKVVLDNNLSFINELLVTGRLNSFYINQITQRPPFPAASVIASTTEYRFYYIPFNVPASNMSMSSQSQRYWDSIR